MSHAHAGRRLSDAGGLPRRRIAWRLATACAAVVLLAVTRAPAAAPGDTIRTPEEFFGFAMGAERRLADWTGTAAYFREIDRLSDRVAVQDYGPTTEGRPYLVATVSDAATIAQLDRYRAIQRRLADPRVTGAAEAESLVREAKVVVLIGAGLHSNEIGSSQMMNDLLHELATSSADWIERVRQQAIVLLVPSQNPDGFQRIVEWHAGTAGTTHEDAPLPELYHQYAGHDNNRDAFMLTQRESQALARLMYHDWLPHVYLDLHQMGGNRARIFVPPFKNPPNPNVDPLVWSEVNLLGQAMAVRLQAAGKTGVLWGEMYSGFWQGANSTNPWWHNMIGLLSEVASARLAAPVFQPHAGGEHAPTHVPGDVPMPPPTDLQFRMNYPDPWLGGRWTLADVVEYHRLAAEGLLDAAAGARELLVLNAYRMHARTIDRFAAGTPFAFVVPPAQHDPGAAAQLLRLLRQGGADVHRARADFVADGVAYPSGTPVVLLAQPFGRWIKDLLEPQRYPDIRWPSPSAPFDRPYDMTAWSLGMLMGVEVTEVQQPFEVPLTRLSELDLQPEGGVRGRGTVYILPHEPNASVRATARLLDSGADVAWATEPLRANGRAFAAGAILVRRAPAGLVEAMARDLGLDVEVTHELPDVDVLALRRPRVALYEPWGGAVDAGWTRWVLEQHEVSYTRLRGADVASPLFDRAYDVLVLPDMPSTLVMRGLQGGPVRPEHRGGIGEDGVARLRAFVEHGGTIVTLGNSAQFAIDHLGVPVTNVVADEDPEAFLCPGSILRISVDTNHPIGFGMPPEADAMVVGNGGFVPAPRGGGHVTIVARYPKGPLLRSGWMIGESRLQTTGAALDVAVGRGRIVMLTFRTQHRAQTLGTFKLLFNAIFTSAAVPRRAASGTQQF